MAASYSEPNHMSRNQLPIFCAFGCDFVNRRSLFSGLRGIDDATQEQDTAGAIVLDQEQKRMVRPKLRRLRRDSSHHPYRRRGSRLGPLLIHVDKRLVNHAAEE